jgi:prepilin-type N-terminal cleavage/methylation domain-containing protein
MTASKRKGGFTLVELMVVAIIVAILAAVAIPLMSANKKRAAATEAEAALGSVRTALRAMYAESGAYNKNLNGATLTAAGGVFAIPGVSAGDLDGKYFKDTCYSLTVLTATTYTIQASGAGAGADAIVAGVTITLDQAGTILRSGL